MKKLLISTFFTLFSFIVFAQEYTVSGVYTDDNGMPVPGVSVVDKGTTNGIQTDFDGKYSIQLSKGSAEYGKPMPIISTILQAATPQP